MTVAPRPSPRVALMVNHAAQYFAPAYRALAASGEVQERVYYWTVPEGGSFDEGFGRHVEWATDLYSGYQWWTPRAAHKSARIVEVCRDLRAYRPHAVLCFGWSSPIAVTGLAYGRAAGLPVLVYGDTNGRQRALTVKGKLRGPVLRTLFTQVSGALSTGAANSQFYQDHGMPVSRIHPGTLPIALHSFRSAGLRHAASQTQTGPNRRLVIGFAGKLVSHKGADELIHAVSELPLDGSWVLRIVGDGPERGNLEDLANRLSLRDHVEFCGFKNSDEIPDFLAAMDIFVMPSRREPRGLVAIEAMAAGSVPVVSSATGVWGESDAVQEGVTGFVYASGQAGRLADILKRLLADRDLRTAVAERARVHAVQYGPDAFVTGVTGALTAVMNARRPSRVARSVSKRA